jgi:hypothetical protein
MEAPDPHEAILTPVSAPRVLHQQQPVMAGLAKNHAVLARETNCPNSSVAWQLQRERQSQSS